MNIFTRSYWSPYFAGIIIGLLQIPMFLLLHASIGSSHSFNSVACSLLNFLADTQYHNIASQCFLALKHWWQLGFVLGILIGAYVSATLAKSNRAKISPVWAIAANIKSFWQRAIMAFVGGFIMVLGANIADGCTSGNGVSGIALLAVGSMIVIGSMFISGMLVVLFYKKV